MSILSKLDGYINESYIFEGYDIAPVEYDKDTNISFDVMDGDTVIAYVKVYKIDGDNVDAVGDTYEFENVYADVVFDEDVDTTMYDKDNIIGWVVPKLMEMGYGENKIIFDGDEVDLESYTASESDVKEPDDIDAVKDEVEDVDGEFAIDDLDDEE